jgi:hypothetical protein
MNNMETRHSRLVKLSAKVDNLVQFAKPGDEEPYKPRRIERTIIGNPLSIAIHGKKGERVGGTAEAFGRGVLGTGLGGLAGIGIGGLAGAALGHGAGMKLGSPFHRPSIYTVGGAIRGAEVGGAAGAIGGGVYATHGKGGEEMYKRRTYGMSSKQQSLVQLNSKLDGIVRFDSNAMEDLASAGAGAGLGIGGYKAYKAIRKKQYGNAGVLVGGPAAGATTAKGFGQAAAEVGRDAYHAAPGAIKTGLQAAGKKGLSVWDKILHGLRLARVPA